MTNIEWQPLPLPTPPILSDDEEASLYVLSVLTAYSSLLERHRADYVRCLRGRGETWEDIGAALGPARLE